MNPCAAANRLNTSITRDTHPESRAVHGSPLLLFAIIAVAGCSDNSTSSTQGQPASLSSLAQLGEKIFHDPSLSAGGNMSCATCHDEQHAFAQTNPEAVAFGSPNLDQPGLRNTPSLKYLSFTPAFHFDDGTPTGGFNRDGRATTLAD